MSETASVFVVQHKITNEWFVILEFSDGEQYIGTDGYVTEEEAKEAASKWVLENMATTHVQ